MKPTLILEVCEETVADKPPVFLPVTEDQLAQQAWIHALRANSDAIERLAKSSERRDAQQAEIVSALADIKTRIALLEHNTLRPWIEDIDRRLKNVETDQFRRQGREGVWAAILRSPFFHWIAAMGVGISAAVAWLKGGIGQ